MAVTSPTDKLRMRLLDAVSCLQLRGKGHLNEIFVSEIPKNWVKHGDLVIIPQNCFRGEQWRLLGMPVSVPFLLACNCFLLVYILTISQRKYKYWSLLLQEMICSKLCVMC